MRLAFAVLILSATPAFALDAVTYAGTLGGHEIIVELTDPAAGDVLGRYSYMSKGGDIPLRAVETSEGIITLAEEAPCKDETCVENEDYEIVDPPVGAHWQLRLRDDGSITGGWIPADGGEALVIALTEQGRRALPDDGTEPSAMMLADSAFFARLDAAEPLTAEAMPYEFLKVSVPHQEGETLELDGSAYRFDVDPRSKFAFPTIVSLADGSSPAAANIALWSRHVDITLAALSCLGTEYAGLGFRSGFGGGGGLGDYDGESIELVYLSPTVVGWTESGSTFCGGAHPNNHFDSHLIETQTGKPLALGKIFSDWVATVDYTTYEDVTDQAAALENPQDYGWSAGQRLIDYVEANRPRLDAETEKDCGMTDLVASNLDMRFEPGDQVVFTLSGLPHAIFACTTDLLTVKLSDIPELLAPTAKDYFPSLAR